MLCGCQIEITAAERSLVQRTTECDVSVSDLETSTMMQPTRPTRAAEQIIRKNHLSYIPHNVKMWVFTVG